MTVPVQTPFNNYVGTGATTVFPFTFLVSQSGDLVVKVGGVALVLGVGYTLTGIGVAGGGTVVMVAPPAALATIAIYRSTAITRTTDYQGNGDFLAPTVNADFDRPWLVLQELFSGPSGFGRMVKAPVGETIGDLPAAAARAGSLLSFDSLGNPIAVAPAAQSATALAIDLASSALPNKNAGQIGFAYALAYAAGTLGKWLQDLATSAGSAFIGFIQAGTGAVLRTVQEKLRESVSLFDYLTTAQIADVQARTFLLDCSAGLQNALNRAFALGVKLRIPGGGYLMTAPVSYVMTGVIADDNGNHAFIEGDGMSNTLFVSTYAGATPLFSITGGTTGTQGVNTWLKIQGLRIQKSGGPVVGQVGLQLTRMSGLELNDVHVYGFDSGIVGTDVLDVRMQRTAARGNNKGVTLAPGGGGYNPNAVTLHDCLITGNFKYGLRATNPGNMVLLGGVIETNGTQGDATTDGIQIVGAGAEAAVGLTVLGTYFEDNAGNSDIRIDHATTHCTYKILANFNRTTTTRYCTNNVQLNITSGTALLDLDGSGFKNFGTYVPNAARPYAAVNPTGSPTWNVRDEQAVYFSSTEAPVWTGRVQTVVSRPAAWARFNGNTAGTNAPTQGYNVATVTRNSVGNYTANFQKSISNNNTGWNVMSNQLLIPVLVADGNASVNFTLQTPAGVLTDTNAVFVQVWGA